MDTHGTYVMKQLVDHLSSGHGLLCGRTRFANVQISDLPCNEHLVVSIAFLSTFGFFDDVVDTEPMAHMMEGLVPRVAPLVHVVTGAGPNQIVQSIITGSYKTNRVQS